MDSIAPTSFAAERERIGGDRELGSEAAGDRDESEDRGSEDLYQQEFDAGRATDLKTSSPPSSAPRRGWPPGRTGCPWKAASRSRRAPRACRPPSERSPGGRVGGDEPPMRLLLLAGPAAARNPGRAARRAPEGRARGRRRRPARRGAARHRDRDPGLGYLDAGELVPDDVVVDLMTPVAAAAAQPAATSWTASRATSGRPTSPTTPGSGAASGWRRSSTSGT
jgi:hypothetical protein